MAEEQILYEMEQRQEEEENIVQSLHQRLEDLSDRVLALKQESTKLEIEFRHLRNHILDNASISPRTKSTFNQPLDKICDNLDDLRLLLRKRQWSKPARTLRRSSISVVYVNKREFELPLRFSSEYEDPNNQYVNRTYPNAKTTSFVPPESRRGRRSGSWVTEKKRISSDCNHREHTYKEEFQLPIHCGDECEYPNDRYVNQDTNWSYHNIETRRPFIPPESRRRRRGGSRNTAKKRICCHCNHREDTYKIFE
ncbi:hypothetical protein SUGI_0077430 [Cryptomeria japonica]|nr:hypothetical protein SUGI_0077430 [Cryptomeria japonica]